MYRVQLIENEQILKYKDFEEYERAYQYSNDLVPEIKYEHIILILEYKDDSWKLRRRLTLKK